MNDVEFYWSMPAGGESPCGDASLTSRGLKKFLLVLNAYFSHSRFGICANLPCSEGPVFGLSVSTLAVMISIGA